MDDARTGPTRLYGESTGVWFLEGVAGGGSGVRRIPILALPFQVGRLPGRGLTLTAPMISGHHAEIFEAEGGLRLRDLGSTNGTRLNGDRIDDDSPLAVGDIIHFAKLEFRLDLARGEESHALIADTLAVDTVLPEPMVDRSRLVRKMIRERSVTAVFQPIVEIGSRRRLGYEALGRGEFEAARLSTVELFKIATVLEAEAELSRLLREACLSSCSRLPADALLFLNTHPKEIGTPELLDSLADFRRGAGERRLVVEIHEQAVEDDGSIRNLREALRELEMEIAYDDFGAGQARLLELAEAPPRFLKFDRSMVQGLDAASTGRRKLTARLVALAGELEIATVAEGIESEAEAAACRNAGFDFAQGYLLGPPLPIDQIGS